MASQYSFVRLCTTKDGVYTGELCAGLREGQGKMEYSNGDVYGEFGSFLAVRTLEISVV